MTEITRAQRYLEIILAPDFVSAPTLRRLVTVAWQESDGAINRKERAKMIEAVRNFAKQGRLPIITITQQLNEDELAKLQQELDIVGPTSLDIESRRELLLEDLAKPSTTRDLTMDEHTLVMTVQKLGGKARRGDILNELGGWNDTRYKSALGSLKTLGLVETAAGRGWNVAATSGTLGDLGREHDNEQEQFLNALRERGSTTNGGTQDCPGLE